MMPEALSPSGLQPAAALFQVIVHDWQITARRFRPTFKDRLSNLASVIPGLVDGPRISFRERHVRVFPHRLEIGAALPVGMYAVRRAEDQRGNLSGPDLELLTGRLWHTRQATLCTEFNAAELARWNPLSAHRLTLSVERISPHAGAQA